MEADYNFIINDHIKRQVCKSIREMVDVKTYIVTRWISSELSPLWFQGIHIHSLNKDQHVFVRFKITLGSTCS